MKKRQERKREWVMTLMQKEQIKSQKNKDCFLCSSTFRFRPQGNGKFYILDNIKTFICDLHISNFTKLESESE